FASDSKHAGTHAFFASMIDTMNERYGWNIDIDFDRHTIAQKQNMIITNERRHYLREISTYIRNYHEKTEKQSDTARKLYQLIGTKHIVDDENAAGAIENAIETHESELDDHSKQLLDSWDDTKEKYAQETMTF